MSVLETISDQMCCNTAVASHALTNASDLGLVALSGGQPVNAPAHGAVSNPSLLTVGRGNPDSGLAIAVMNEESPFGLELGNVIVGNLNGAEGVYYDQVILSEDQPGSNPEQGCCGTNGGCCDSIDDEIAVFGGVKNSLSQKEGIKGQSHATPNQIPLRAVNRQVLHLSIIAGTPADGKGK